MPHRAVHWEEGMFLTPQHFQAADRHARRVLGEAEEWSQPFPWGFHSIVLDEGTVATASTVSLQSCQARFKDGTHLTVGETGDVPPLSLDLAEVLKAEEQVDVYLGVPKFELGTPNVEESSTERGPRFSIDLDECVDENTGKRPQEIKFRKLQARLLHSSEDRSGYEVLPLVRIRRGPEAGSRPEVDGSAVPALLAMDAWPWLRDLTRSIAREVRARVRQLAELAVDREISFRGQDAGDAERLLKLYALNEVEPPLALLATTPGVAPWTVYLELCRTVGRLGLFLRTRRPPKLPPYDHDRLGPCFATVIQLIRLALEGAEPIKVVAEPFTRVGQHLQVNLQESWIDLRRIHLGVQTELSAEECDALLKDQQIDRTIGSGAQVEGLYARRSRGLSLAPVGRPDGLPRKPDVVYFRIDPTEPRIWQGVVNDRTLAIRFNTTNSPFQNGEEVRVSTRAGKLATLRFVLYVTPNS
ncbi:MAG: type VI secretion system baseplate subunit TssK [Isosphaeraceae bacterium]